MNLLYAIYGGWWFSGQDSFFCWFHHFSLNCLNCQKLASQLARVHQMGIWLIISQFRYIENAARTFLSTLKAVCCILVAIICIFICFFSVSCFAKLITHCAEYAINFNLAAYLLQYCQPTQRATVKECVCAGGFCFRDTVTTLQPVLAAFQLSVFNMLSALMMMATQPSTFVRNSYLISLSEFSIKL